MKENDRNFRACIQHFFETEGNRYFIGQTNRGAFNTVAICDLRDAEYSLLVKRDICQMASAIFSSFSDDRWHSHVLQSNTNVICI